MFSATGGRFTSCWEKFRRAEQHIDELERRIVEFHATDPYSIVAEDKPETGQRVVRVAKTTPLPADLPLILGDAVHNARSAFDHFAYQAIPNPTSETSFPVHRKGSPTKANPMKGKVNGQLKGGSSELLKAVTSCGPYQGGAADYLWVLDYLDIMDKHKLLVPIATAYSSLTLDVGGTLRDSGFLTRPASSWRCFPLTVAA